MSAVEAFRKYAWHLSTCPTWDHASRFEDCDCGFLAAWDEVVGGGFSREADQ